MKKTFAIMSVLALTIPAAAREFNDIGSWRQEMREIRVEEAKSEVVRHTPTDAKGCAILKLDDVVISRGVFSSDFTVESGGAEIAKIETGTGYTIKSGSAVSAMTGASGSAVTDCGGAVIGWVEELAGDDSSSFVIKNAVGAIVASSGNVDGAAMILRGSGGMVAVSNNHWLIDSYKVTTSGIDPRLAAMAVMRNNAALYRRSAQRRRDNPREPHGGRGDR